jgi:hypothetical protein
MKTLIIINCVVAIITLILTLEIVESTATMFKKDYPNVKLNKVSVKAKMISYIAMIIRSLIPIYNIIVLLGTLFMRDTLIDKGYDILINRIVED